MKKLFALLLFLMVPLAPVGAQGLHGKILLLQDSIWRGGDNLQATLRTNYSGVVDSEFALPSDLSGYDAVLMVVP